MSVFFSGHLNMTEGLNQFKYPGVLNRSIPPNVRCHSSTIITCCCQQVSQQMFCLETLEMEEFWQPWSFVTDDKMPQTASNKRGAFFNYWQQMWSFTLNGAPPICIRNKNCFGHWVWVIGCQMVCRQLQLLLFSFFELFPGCEPSNTTRSMMSSILPRVHLFVI